MEDLTYEHDRLIRAFSATIDDLDRSLQDVPNFLRPQPRLLRDYIVDRLKVHLLSQLEELPDTRDSVADEMHVRSIAASLEKSLLRRLDSK